MTTTERIAIKITQDGARATRREIEGLGAGADKAGKALGGLGSALKAAVAGAAVREVIKIADGYTTLSNTVRFATKTEREMIAVRKELFDVSNANRQSVETTAEVYGKLRLSTQALGLSQREVIELTDTLSKATIVSGASSENAANALRQLGQGMAAGALRGDELNSVLENTPYIADVIAKSLGKDIGAIRQMGAEGKITGKIIADAFKGARQEIAERFAKTVPTVSQSVEVLKNAVTELVGELDSATGSTASLSANIIGFAEDLRAAIPQLKVLVSELTDMSNIKGPGDWFFEMFGDQGVSKLEFWALGIASIKEGIAALSNVPSLGFTRAFDEAGARFQAFMRDLSAAKGVRLGARFPEGGGEGPTLPPGHSLLDPLGAKGTAKPSSLPAAKGATVQSILDDLKRENDLLRMGNEQRKIEEGLDRARSALKGKLSGQAEANIRYQLEENRVLEVINESIEEQLKLELELMELEERHRQERGEIAARRAAEVAAIGAEARQAAIDATPEGAMNVMGQEFLANVRTVGQELALIFGPGGTLQQGMLGVVGSLSDAIGYSIAFGRSWNDTAEAIQNIGRSIIAEIISSLIRIPIQMGINEAIASGLRAKATAETVAQASTTAAAWAPAAAGASLATAGGNSVGATAAIVGVSALALGALAVAAFEEGGYTGNGSRSGVAGLVHGQEYVLNADATRRYRGEAEAMNAGTWRPGGGGGVKVTIVNQAPGVEFETRQLNEGHVEVIARRVVQELAPEVIANDMRSPQGKTGRAMSQTTTSKRVRS